MTLLNFAYKIISRDFKTYFFHFISCTFSVFVFFIFTNLTFHPALKVVDKDSTIGVILNLVLLISLLFSFVFILYSVNNFLKLRSRQFAILNIIGSTNKQFKRIIFYENGLISLGALICGTILGIVFSKFFLMIAETIIGGLNLYFYLPIKAMIFTLLLMGGLFLFISIIAPIVLRKKKIISLLKKEDEAESSYLPIVGLGVAIIIPILIYNRHSESLLMYPLYLLAFILVSYFIFNLLFVVYMFVMKHTKLKFKGAGLIKVSNFNYHIHTNLKTMAITMMLFTITLTSLIYIIGAPRNVEKTTQKILPYSLMYSALNKNIDDKEKANKIKETLKDYKGFKFLEVNYLKFSTPNRDVLISNSMYNKIAKYLKRKPVALKDHDYYMIGTDGKNVPKMGELMGKDLERHQINNNKGSTPETIALSGYFTSVTVISDTKYERLSPQLENNRFFAYQFDDWKHYNDEPLAKQLNIDQDNDSLSSAYWYYTTEKLQRNIIAYVGSVLCISFLIGIASLTYSRLYSSAETEIKKYETMIRLGISKQTIKHALSSTIIWIFLLPFIVALMITWGFVIYLDQYTVISYYKIAMYCSLTYLLIEVGLYYLIKYKYQRKIFEVLYQQK
ncbi:FtsX-like permease family protein [Staphylococcus agnetis]|uniref:FtsX-like permease family protein n=2 Tax=Staphylococcus agnetis TaxID=985762 RepID=UPI000D1A9821|nr:ABC transporter permease [Staphylococcus agnetis]PTH35657.1 ABC transporter permease [Staphylococcus agnetis]PTH77536.1 ABC transporter permease [Staphylococcus agnetis]